MNFDFSHGLYFGQSHGNTLFDEIRKEISLEKIFKRYSLVPTKETKQGKYYTYFSNNGEKINIYKDNKENIFTAIDFKKLGNNIDFISNIQKLDILNAAIFLMLLSNHFPIFKEKTHKDAFEVYSLRFNFLFLTDSLNKVLLNTPVFMSKEKLDIAKTELLKLGFSNRNIKKLHLKRMEDKYVIPIRNHFFITDFIAYDKTTDKCFSVLYKEYKQL